MFLCDRNGWTGASKQSLKVQGTKPTTKNIGNKKMHAPISLPPSSCRALLVQTRSQATREVEERAWERGCCQLSNHWRVSSHLTNHYAPNFFLQWTNQSRFWISLAWRKSLCFHWLDQKTCTSGFWTNNKAKHVRNKKQTEGISTVNWKFLHFNKNAKRNPFMAVQKHTAMKNA